MSKFNKLIESIILEDFENIEIIDEVNIPDGEYDTKRYGYTLEINNQKLKTKDGIRCMERAASKKKAIVKNNKIKIIY